MCAKRYDKETKTITHTAPLLKHLKLLSLNDIYYLNLALFAYDAYLLMIYQKYSATTLKMLTIRTTADPVRTMLLFHRFVWMQHMAPLRLQQPICGIYYLLK